MRKKKRISFNEHNLNTLELKLICMGDKKISKLELVTFLRKGQTSMNFIAYLRERWERGINYQELWTNLIEAQNITLKVRKIMKVIEKEVKRMTMEKWMAMEILEEIVMRNKCNRKMKNTETNEE